jgi:hypothetical protein
MSKGAHLAGGIVLLWLACVCYYVAFTMGHSATSPGYFTKTERQLATNLQAQSGQGASFTSIAQTTGAGTTATDLGLTMGGGV